MEIESKHLMEGDYYYDKNNKIVSFSNKDYFRNILILENYLDEEFKMIRPILLTSEHLYNFGFSYNEKSKTWFKDDFSFKKKQISKDYCVHELQSLYNFLTGKKLIFINEIQ